jgi:hypothetical protein
LGVLITTGNGNGQRSSTGGSNFETLLESVHFPSPLSSARSGLRPPFSSLRPKRATKSRHRSPSPLPSFLPYSHTPPPSTTTATHRQKPN